MRILFIGEIVGKAGIFTVKKLLPGLMEEYNIDFVIANANGATGGFGLGKNHSIMLHKQGIDLLTAGDFVYFKKDMVSHIGKTSYILRPANYPPGAPGRGWGIFQVGGTKLGIITMLGQSGYTRVHLNNPFTYLPEIVKKIKNETSSILVNFHATTTAEKQTMIHHLKGNVSAVLGTGTRVMTADCRITDGTAIMTDTGRTGSFLSVGGLDPEIEIQKFLTQIPERSKETWNRQELQGVVLEINPDGTAKTIIPIKKECSELPEGQQIQQALKGKG